MTRYPVPISKPGFPTGSLMITMDKNGMIWECMMGQAQIAMLDPKTEKVSIYLAPDWDKADTRFTNGRRPAFERRWEIVDQDQWWP